MSKPILTFIGAGNMANSIIGGLITQEYPAERIIASDPLPKNLEVLKSRYGIETTQDNLQAVSRAKVVVLAVKPQIMKTVAESLSPALSHQPMVISIAAGISMNSLQHWLESDARSKELSIVRCMPNTPALVGEGASGLYANQQTSAEQKQTATDILSAVGTVSWLDKEELINSVIAVSGSGPAYFFLLMESMIEAAIAQGLSADTARELTLQTALGAAKLAQASDVNVDELRRRVMSPGGTTEQAIASLEKSGFRSTVSQAMKACADRSIAMSRELGSE